MTTTHKTASKQTRRPATRRTSRSRRPRRRTARGRWAVGTIAAVGVVGLFLLYGGRSPTENAAANGRAAPGFTLPTTAGTQVSLSSFRGRDVLLYFSEGVGCDPCFLQQLDIERNASLFENAGVTVLPIVVDPVGQVQQQIARFGIKTPYLIDQSASVSRAYDRLGKGMHANLPGHGFVLVDASGKIRWTGEYPSMYISASDLFAKIKPYL